jgi:hypothetical protein
MIGIKIDPTQFYDATLFDALEISQATVGRARRAGDLRFTSKGKRTLYLGQWVLDWLINTEDAQADMALSANS